MRRVFLGCFSTFKQLLHCGGEKNDRKLAAKNHGRVKEKLLRIGLADENFNDVSKDEISHFH